MAEAPKDDSMAVVVAQGQTGPFTSTAMVVSSEVKTAGFDLSEVKKLVTQTKAIGVILPPPDIRAIVDKTASFVAKHGPEFEKRILANERNNAKFNFLVTTDPYHAYYKMRIKNFSEGEGAAEGGKDAASAAAAVAEFGKAGAPGAPQVIPHALAKLEKPEEELYTVHLPEGLSLLELDMIKLAAQFVARNGQSFLTGLASREHTNPQFNFLKPTHSLFGVFKTFCDAYSRVLMPPKGTKDKVAKDAADSAGVLERAMKRLEYEKVRERELQEEADEAERERLAYQSVDWHEFVVVETLQFFDDEDESLPAPLSLRDIVNMNKARELQEAEEKRTEEARKAAQEKAAQGVAMTDEEKALIAQAAAVSLVGNGNAVPAADIADAEMEVEDMDAEHLPPTRPAAQPPVPDDDDEGPIKIVKDYVRPQAKLAMLNGQAYDPTKFAVSPITGELVAIADMAEHMRVSLIDPRWKEQREAMLSKIRDNTKAADDEITRNLVGLAKTRPDIFGSTEEEVTQVVSESIREKLTSGANRPVAWDGVTQRGPELQTQLQNIQQNRQQLGIAPGQPGAAPPRPAGPPVPAQFPPPPGVPRPVMPPPAMGAPPPGPPGVRAPMIMTPAGMAAPPPPGGMLPPRPMMPPPPMTMPPPLMPPVRPPMPAPGAQVPLAPPQHAPPREAPPPMPGDQPEAKRARLDDVFVLRSEEEFLQQHPGASSVRVQCPEVDGNEKLIGQMLEVKVASLSDTVGEFKERLSTVLGLAANKMKLARDGVGFLRDEFSLAHYNVDPNTVLQLGTKERARGKKN